MIGRQFGILPSQPPNWTATDVRAFLRRDAVERIGIVRVLLEITLGIVKADRPERVDWHVGRDVEPIDRVAVVPGWGEARIARVLVRITAPTGGGSDQMLDRINLLLGTERVLEAVGVCGQNQQRVSYVLLAGLVPVGTSNLPGALWLTLIASCKS